ncbi:cadmium, zinc and cobalt-transporting P-type ATPase CadA [Gottschalkia acidurici 9a]|uniref:Cadmium, zinc and cobalt-transporting P-type ATPase CadA n=1 Tax=Gottschalkia acidurici (strain ATCC 7906 / DSM 604 / BCRC 14475 / CIP 104303 / KCTC 5404 / NCIMB 10678 / 9a) TaxID=1128398 RepID=K0AV19_GOTA9|nr:cadmium, zinc and cobalt-transporting P-type ATPase CadA [Gottschalkia acidurici 9a]
MSSKEIILQGLNCASCISKIEQQTSKIEGVEESKFNFASEILTVDYRGKKEFKEVFKEIKDIVNKAEPHVKVRMKEEQDEHNHDHGHDHSHDGGSVKKNIIRFSIGGILLLISYIFNLESNIKAGLILTSYVLIGYDVVLRAFKNILRGQIFDEHFLMTVATFGAIAIKEYPEAVAVMLFYQVGETFQDIAVGKSRRSIKSLLDIRPDYANLKVGETISTVSPEKVNIGDTIIVKPGERVPLDGKVIEGSSMVNTSALTGESVPRSVNKGDEILSGFINENGILTIEVTKSFGESTVSKILDLVQNASGKKAPTEKFITKFARYYTPVVVISAILIAFIPPIILGQEFYTWVYRALVFLVISCPCALVVSVPLGFFGGIGAASKSGILVKGGNYLEALNDIEILVMDKTGTLTKGIFEVTKIDAQEGFSEEEILKFSALGEIHSSHPIATSIKKAYGKELDYNKIENYEEVAGHGIKATIEGKEVLIGNIKLMNRENIDAEKSNDIGTIVYVAIENKYAGSILISDEIKEDAHKTIQSLHNLGIKKAVMLTGDNKNIAEKVAKDLGIDEVYSELLPIDKVSKVEALNAKKSEKGKLAFVGDGINDAPVLAMADIGIAMGGLGSDAAIEASDIVLMTDEISKISTSIKIARKTKKIVIQNIVLALGTKSIVLVLGVFGIANMWVAVFADVGVALIAILNSMRALKIDK